jgi:hypothetical protein
MSLRQLARAAGPLQAWREALLRGPLLYEASTLEGNHALSSLAALAAAASRRPPHDWAGSGALHLAARSCASQAAAQMQGLPLPATPGTSTQPEAGSSRSSYSAAAQAQAAVAEAERPASPHSVEAGWPLDDPIDCSMCDPRAPFDEEAAAAADALGQHRLGTRPIPTADAPNEQAGRVLPRRGPIAQLTACRRLAAQLATSCRHVGTAQCTATSNQRPAFPAHVPLVNALPAASPPPPLAHICRCSRRTPTTLAPR